MKRYMRTVVKTTFVILLLFVSFNTFSSAETIPPVATIPSAGRDFWLVHGLFGGLILCLFLAVFPRLTLAFIALVTGGIGISFLGIILWILAPHLLVAIIATTIYWHTNPILVILAWFIAFGGETTEKVYLRRRF